LKYIILPLTPQKDSKNKTQPKHLSDSENMTLYQSSKNFGPLSSHAHPLPHSRFIREESLRQISDHNWKIEEAGEKSGEQKERKGKLFNFKSNFNSLSC
jgi:hypothetical protein